ncbi:MAG: carotenoid oxygenase family protein [Thermaurantiacus tibetensis]|uniref:carotenoid oxygenase family protein n=1 Tax=Thermaurantiacus tibetensis TaxID=2759035 RepID=UPI00189072D5|nr:carotenoid oxygenase family protein [Thermaurantiacus tibetensis]
MAGGVEAAIRGVVGTGLAALAGFNRGRMRPDPNPWMNGVFAPVTEEVTLEGLEVRGTIPEALDGLYVRNGANPLGTEHQPSHHWFLGQGMVHGVRLKDGRALWYRNRWVRSNAVSAFLGEAPAPGPRHPLTDVANTNVVDIGGKTYAIVEAAGYPVELGPDLATLRHDPFGGTLTTPFSAHPHRDPATGKHHAICYEGAPNGRVWHVVVSPGGRVERAEEIAVADGPSIHDCAITERHILVFDLPVTFALDRYLKGHRFPLAWNPRHPARVGVLGLEAPGASIRWCAVDPCYVFHPANAFEVGDGTIVCDLVVHDRMFWRSTSGPDAQRITLERWTLDPAAGTVARRVLDDRPQEFPRIDERRTGRRHGHVWTAEVDLATVVATPRLLAHDVEAGSSQVHDFGPGAMVGEFVHVPRGKRELEGWLVGLVAWPGEGRSALMILDAADIAAPPVAEVRIPRRIPPGFHGNWIPALPA